MTAKILSCSGDNVITDVDDRKDGKYIISFTPFHPGSYQVEITVRQELIADCPMTIFVNPRTTRSASTLGPSLRDLRPRSRDYRAVMSFGGKGELGGMFRRPAGIAMNRLGEIAVVDSGNHRIQLFTGKGECMGQFGTEGAAEGQLQGKYGFHQYQSNSYSQLPLVAITIDSFLHISLTLMLNIHKFQSGYELLTTLCLSRSPVFV